MEMYDEELSNSFASYLTMTSMRVATARLCNKVFDYNQV